jgi:hypothetical protein
MSSVVIQVLQEIKNGQGAGLAEVARAIPGRAGGGVNSCTPFRWCTKGAKAVDGSRVRLEHIRCGSRILTSWPAFERFIAALTVPGDAPPAPRSPAATRRAVAAAEAELVKVGA